ncbi:MAG: GspE/PulE family protein [Myxococcota bacterium]|jgi:general secretion pathway protein E|nr:GspE/PulE family protein [Myxococcota bacterium]
MAETRRVPHPTPVLAGDEEAFRPPLSLDELLEILIRTGALDPAHADDLSGRRITLRSQVLKDKVGSVRSQAAARYDVSPAEIVAAVGYAHAKEPRRTLNEETIAQCIAEAALYPYLKPDPLGLDNDLVTRSFSRAYAHRHVVVPVGRDGDNLELAIADPFDSALRESIETTLGRPVQYVISSKRDILAIIERVHGFRSKVDLASEELEGGQASTALVELVELQSNAELSASTEAHVVAAVDYLLKYAFDQRASDIHLDPKQAEAGVRFRIDGILHDIEQLPLSVHAAIASRIKVLARMDVAERRRPQDGRIKTQNGDQEVELRVSSMPTAYGEKIVIRVFDPNVLMAELHELGFTNAERERFESWITSPSGLVLVTGPTGSGKTTTLYSTLRYLAGPEINITSVEDPIELIDPRFSQVQVQPQIDVTFARALRTILRQDPDIIMVGEIRDAETANMAVQAALTGHLVFSTVHTRDAAGAVTRLVELGVEPFLLSSVLRGVVAQRLVRRICPHCGVDGHLSAAQVEALGIKIPVERRDQLQVRFGQGCADCRTTGLYGRIGIFELLDVGKRVQGLIRAGRDANEIAEAGRIEGMESLRESAIRCLAEGVTTFEEVVRITADRA